MVKSNENVSMDATRQEIQKAIRVVNDGGVIIYPTDTAFGIGCRIDDTKAVDRLFSLRKRPLTQPTPVLVSSENMALPYFIHPDDIVRRLMKIYWPGALTIVSYCHNQNVYSPIRGGSDKIGLRMPNHKTALAIISGVDVPILGPSANFHGRATPFYFKDLDPELVKLVDYVVPGECKTKLVSTVVDCTIVPFTIIRQGAVAIDAGLLI